ncbi:hypothetical protein AgCh_006802 [Apium graveolens]
MLTQARDESNCHASIMRIIKARVRGSSPSLIPYYLHLPQKRVLTLTPEAPRDQTTLPVLFCRSPTAATPPQQRRIQSPYMVNIVLAGYDKETGPSLYFIDYIATLHKVDKAAFGYGAFFSLAMMDRHYRSDMSVEEAVDLVDKCILEIRSRLVVAPPNFVIKIVDKDGARTYAWRETHSINSLHLQFVFFN